MTPDTLKDWLEGRDQRVAVTITFRIAARLWPLPNWSGQFEDAGLAPMRALLIAERAGRAPVGNASRGIDENALRGVAAAVTKTGSSLVNPLDLEAIRLKGLDVVPVRASSREAQYVSTLASFAMAVAVAEARSNWRHAVQDAAGIVAQYSKYLPHDLLASISPVALNGTIDATLRADCKCIEDFGLKALWKSPLWSQGHNPLQAHWHKARSVMLRDSRFGFFHRWYDGLLVGNPVNWGILSEVANISPEDWDQGPAHIADRISEIELRHIRVSTPLAERVEWVPRIERIRIMPVPMDDAATWDMILDKLRDALHDMRPDGTLRNAHAALQDTLEILERTLSAYSGSPQRVHDDMETALSEVRRLVEAGEVPDDMRVQRLMRVIDENTLDIQGNVPSVLEAVSSRAALRLRRLAEGDRKTLVEVTNAVIPLLEEKRLQEEMEKDLEALGEPDPNTEECRIGIYRWASRLSRICQVEKVRAFIAQAGKETLVGVAIALLLGVLGL